MGILGFLVGGGERVLADVSGQLPLSISQVPQGQPISLKDAVREALERRPALKAFSDQVKASRERVGESKAGYFPNLSASYSDTIGNSIFGYFLIPGYQYANYNLLTVGITQTVLDFGRVHSQVRQSLVDAASHLDEARARVAAGVGLRLDVTQAKVNYESARLDLIHEVTGLRKAQVDLGRAIGFRHKKPFEASDPAGESISARVNPEADIAKYLPAHPELLSDVETVRSRKAALDSAKNQNYPTITGSAQYYLAQISISFFGLPTTPFSTFNVGGLLNVPIFEGGLITHQIHEARAGLHQSMHQKEDDEVRLMAGIRDAAEDVREARERLRETRTALDNAEENDRLIEAAYRVGTAHSVDVVDAETALRRARVNVDSARFDLLSSLVQYRYALGTLSSADTP